MGVYTAVQSAMNASLAAFAATSGDCVVWEGTHVAPPDQTLYLEPKLLPGQSRVATLGAAGYVEVQGIFQISVIAPAGRGWKEAQDKADALCTLYAKGTQLTSGAYTIRILRVWEGPALIDVTAGWKTSAKSYCIPISVHWSVYFTG